MTRSGLIRAKKQLPDISYRYVNKKKYSDLCKDNGFVRNIQKELLEWKKQPARKILQLCGARQIDKTTEILKFAYKNYDYVIYINLAADGNKFVQQVIGNGVSVFSMSDYCRDASQGIFAKNTGGGSGGKGDRFNTIPIYTIGTHFPYE